MENNEKKYGFIPSVIDGTEIIFGASPNNDAIDHYSYRQFLPGVINQGSLSICVPCSCSAYLNWRENIKDGVTKDNKITMMDIYNSKTNLGDGMTYKEAFRYLRHNGVRSSAGVLKIKSYGLVKNILSLKQALIMNGPCFGALPVYSEKCDFWVKYPGDQLFGYHAISIVGFNKDGFIIRNSWGTSFCDGGYTTIPYEDFGKFLELWTIIE